MPSEASSNYFNSDYFFQGQACFIALSEARLTIGWLARHFVTATIQEVGAYFQRDASTLSRQIWQLDSAGSGYAGVMP